MEDYEDLVKKLQEIEEKEVEEVILFSIPSVPDWYEELREYEKKLREKKN